MPEHRQTKPSETFAEAHRREVELIKRWAKAAQIDEKVFAQLKSVAEIAQMIEDHLAKFFTGK